MEKSEPQFIKDWYKEQESELASYVEGKNVPYKIALRFMKRYFEKGFKTARRDRTALADHLISEMEKRFNIMRKGNYET